MDFKVVNKFLPGKTLSLILLSTLLAIVLSSCSSGGNDGEKTSNNPNQIQIPNVVGLDETTATNNLSNLDFNVMVVREPRNAPINEVVGQSPLDGQFVGEGSTVTITVSQGISVPNLVAMTEAEAIQSLTNRNLDYSVSYENNNALSGHVINQSIEALTYVDPGTTVEFIVSLGIALPDVVGLDANDAIVTLENLGFAVETNLLSNPAPLNQVFSQEPSQGTNLDTGSIVTISISIGESETGAIQVPDLTGESLTNAIQLLQNLGLTSLSSRVHSPFPIDTVINQSITPGTVVIIGTEVGLSVSDGLIVPDVSAMNVGEATTILESEGFTVEHTYVIDNLKTVGEVYEQTPAAGTNTNGTVLVTLSVFAKLIADAGPIRGVHVGDVVELDGTHSQSPPLPISYNWSFVSKPAGSTAILNNPEVITPSFAVDKEGTYSVELIISTNSITSKRAIGIVVATIAPDPPGPFIHTGLSSNCFNCHYDNVFGIGSKSGNHLATSNLCAACHSPLGFTIIDFVDHKEIFGNCSECHNGNNAIGKSSFHVPTNAECSDCHNTDSFLELLADGSFNHSTITADCSGCHNGVVATEKHENHINTQGECNRCHSVMAFVPAFFDHTDVTDACFTCHDGDGPGISAIGQSQDHPVIDPNTTDCGICHNTLSFVTQGEFDHSVIRSDIQSCESCHNGVTSTAKTSAPPHPDTNSDCGNCHNTETFIEQFVDHAGQDVVGNRCDTCHNNSPVIGLSINHMPLTTEDCGDCHTPGTFASGTYDHSGVINGCAACHDNEISIGKPGDHVPTTLDCSACHAIDNFETFAGASFDHTGITSGCADCHDGEIATGKKLNHIPTNDDCSVCHQGASIFAVSNFLNTLHAGYTDGCAACHDGVLATGKIINHIPAQNECSLCHQDKNIGGFANTIFLTDVHPNLSNGCGGCHEAPFLGTGFIKAPTHLPTQQDCHFCHSVNNTFAAHMFDHTGITGNCASCHDGSFTAIGARGKDDGLTLPHPDTNEDCGSCHNTTNFADAYIDHSSAEVLNAPCDSCHDAVLATGKTPDHLPTNDDCGVCHVPGTFAKALFDHTGIVNNCDSCHNGTLASGKTLDHWPTQEDCAVCHNTVAFASARFEHTGITEDCVICHNGILATGKHGAHVPTNNDCSQCHMTTGFNPAKFDHTGIVDNCVSCHDGVISTGKAANHIPTLPDCGDCHNTNSFADGIFDHSTIGSNTTCDSCHGVTTIGKSPDHISTTLDCSNCHSTATFVSAIWDHANIPSGTCESCHNGLAATGKPNGHFVTSSVCDTCHLTISWAPVAYNHLANSDYPGDHKASVGCISCHKQNSQNMIYQWPQYASMCASCHAGEFDTTKHQGGLAWNLTCGNSGCHGSTDRNW